MANILLDNNQTTKALDVLSKIYQDNTVSEKIREIAAVKLATYKIDSASYAEIESMLGPIVRKGGAWAPMAKELLAMSAIQNKDMAKAKALYEELLAEISQKNSEQELTICWHLSMKHSRTGIKIN